MTPDRRTFIQHLGIAMAALAMARCRLGGSSPSGTRSGSPRDRLRACWTSFDWLSEQTQRNLDGEYGEESMQRLLDDHRAALDELVAAGELDAAVAGEVQTAFGEATYHIWRSLGPMTCYEPLEFDYEVDSRVQLLSQAAALQEMAEGSTVDPETAARARAVIERDIAFLRLTRGEERVLFEQIEYGDEGYPSLAELDLQIPPETAEAARFLVELLLEE